MHYGFMTRRGGKEKEGTQRIIKDSPSVLHELLIAAYVVLERRMMRDEEQREGIP